MPKTVPTTHWHVLQSVPKTFGHCNHTLARIAECALNIRTLQPHMIANHPFGCRWGFKKERITFE